MGPLHPMGLPSEPPFPHHVPLGGCHRLLRLCRRPAPPPISFNARTQPQCPGMGVEGSVLACPFPPGVPESWGLSGRENTWEGASLEPLIHLLPKVSVFWGPPSSSWPGKVWRFPGRPQPHPTVLLPSAPSLLYPGEGVWTVSSTSGIQVVIKIIIIIKKNLKKLEYGGWCSVVRAHTLPEDTMCVSVGKAGLVLVPGRAWQAGLRKEVGAVSTHVPVVGSVRGWG